MPIFPRPVGPEGPVLLTRDARRVRIVLLSGVGDVVHGLPLACDLARTRPDVRITWVAEPVPAQVLLHHPAIHRVIVYRKGEGLSGLHTLRRALAEAGRADGGRPDVTVNVQRYLKSVWPTLLQRGPVRVGLPRSEMRDGIAPAHTHVLAEREPRHVQDLFLDFRWALGVPRDAPPEWGIVFCEEERAEQRRFLERIGPAPKAGLVLASANPRKDWPAERWAALAAALLSDFGLDVLLLGGPGPRELTMARTVRGAVDGAVSCLADDLRRLMWLVDACDVVVSPDSGPLHLAHALGVPVIGLYGHTSPARVGPYARFRDLVVDRYTEPGREPDPAEREPKPGRMERITVGDVLAKVELALARRR